MNPPGTSRLILLAILFLICPMLNVSEGNDQKKSLDSSRSSLIELSRSKVTAFTAKTAVVDIFNAELAGGFTVSPGESVTVRSGAVVKRHRVVPPIDDILNAELAGGFTVSPGESVTVRSGAVVKRHRVVLPIDDIFNAELAGGFTVSPGESVTVRSGAVVKRHRVVPPIDDIFNVELERMLSAVLGFYR